MPRDEQLTNRDGLVPALRAGADAVFVFRRSADGTLVGELVNEAARLLFGIPREQSATAILNTSCPAQVRPIIAGMEQAATRSRATRETLLLSAPDGSRLAVDLHLEPLSADADGARILAVLRASDPAFEPGAGSTPGTIGVGVLRYEPGLGVVFVDDALLVLLGLAHEHALGQGWLDAIHPDDRSRVADAFAEARERAGVLDLEFRLAGPHLRERWARLRAVPERRSGDTVDGYLVTIEDITDQRVMTQSGARLAELADAVEDWVGIVDAAGHFVYANAVARQGLGLPDRDHGPGVTAGIMAFEPRSAEVRMATESLHTGIWTGPIVLMGSHGRRIELAGTIRSHAGPDGTVDHYSFTGRDTADARFAAHEMLRLRRAVESTTDLITFHARGGRLLFANRAARALIGIGADDPLPPLEMEQFFISTPDQQREMRQAIIDAGRWAGELLVRGHDARIPASVVVTGHRDASGRYEYFSALARDISEQRASERARRRSEAALRAVVQSSPLAIFALDPEITVHIWNRASESLFGWPAAEAVGRAPRFVASPEELEALTMRAFAGETVLSHDARFVHRDGHPLDVSVSVAPLRNASDRIVSVVVVVADVSDQRRAEHALRESEVRFRSLVQESSDMVTIVERDGLVTYRSPSASRFLGLDPDEPADRDAQLGLFEEDRPALRAVFERLYARPGGTETVRYRFERHDGALRWIEMVVTNHLDDEAVRGIVANCRDVTDRVEAEESVRASAAQLRDSEARYRAIVDDQTDLVCRFRPDATLTFTSRAFAEFFGATGDELVGSRLVDLRPATERATTFAWLATFTHDGSVQTHPQQEVALDGSLRWYEWTTRAFADESGQIVEFQSVGHDVTEQRRAAALTVHQAEILEQVARGVALDETLLTISRALEDQFPRFSCAIMLIDEDGTALRGGVAPSLAPRVFESLYGTPVAPTAGSSGSAAHLRTPVYVPDVTADARWADRHEILVAHGLRAAWSVPVLSSDGSDVLGTLDVFVAEPGVPDDEQRRIFAMLAQVATIAIERKAFEQRLAHQSMHDPLTGLPNRLLFLDRLSHAIARCRRSQTSVGVAFLDLDRFKNVNDSLGHDAGDELLVEVARKLEAVIRPGDTVARFGGDEFTVLCEDLPLESAREQTVDIADRLRAAVIRPLVVRGTEMFVGASIGIALAASGEERPEEMLRDADAAMYHAKAAGRGRVEVFDDAMRARALSAHATENALHRALERGEFRIFFQPIVGLSDARCRGAEALVRWQHPERGLLAPAEFIPLAEETGLVVEIGWWVLEEAARNAARWQLEQSEPFQVAVNLSARQLTQPDLADRVAEVIATTGVQPAALCFEITESVLMDDAAAVLDIITRIRALGVDFSIDDFGTGYSSLGYLKRFPVDSVKIDRSFVNGLGSDPGDDAIVSAVIGLAHALGLRVIAEGVEAEEQLTALIALECDEAQGYFFAPPQPAPDLRSLIARTRTWRPPGARVMRPADGSHRRPVNET